MPVYETSRHNVVGLINIKDLVLLDPKEQTPIKTLCKFYNHPLKTVFDDTPMDIMLGEMSNG